jgi:hypothetical protein
VDTIRISERLWNDDAVRAAAVAQAQGAVATPTATPAPIPSGAAATATPTPTPAPTKAQAAADQVDQIKQLHFPLGWGAKNEPDGFWSAIGHRIAGWLITIAALSLGAPFWFDLLSRLARLRSAGVTEQPRTLSDSAQTASGDRSAPSSKLPDRLGEPLMPPGSPPLY